MRKKNMTVGSLLEKLNTLLLKGVVKSSTPVCGFADEFQHFYPLRCDAEIVVDTAPWIKENMDFVKRHEDGNMSRVSVERRKKEAASLKRLGKVVVCLNNHD